MKKTIDEICEIDSRVEILEDMLANCSNKVDSSILREKMWYKIFKPYLLKKELEIIP